MDKITVAELISLPSIVFFIEYGLMISRNLGRSVEFSLFMAAVTFLFLVRRNMKNGYLKLPFNT